MRPTVVVMLKEPHPGQVKTRLAKGIGTVAAAWWFRHAARGLLRRLEDPRWRLVLAVSPDAEGLRSRIWPRHLARIPQGAGSLGDRMGRIFRSLPPGPVLIIGADIPGVNRRAIASAIAALRPADAVIGPAEDGGYWLIGLKRSGPVPARLFEGVRWSTRHALTDTERTMTGLRIARTLPLRDVDTAADLSYLSRRRIS